MCTLVRRLRAGLAGLLLAAFCACPALADKRVALIVANGAYKGAPLSNPPLDADLVKSSLEKIGFDVEVAKDADLGSFDAVLRRFGERAKGADIALFYFAGHGFAVNEGIKPVSLLMATSADITSASERVLRSGGIPLDDVVQSLTGTANVTLVFVDACRNDPRVSRAIGGAGRGFSRLDLNKSGGLFIGLSTRLGETALDGDAGKGSPFARAFAATIPTKGLRIDDAFRRLRDVVKTETEGREIPDIVQDDLPDGAIILAAIDAAPPAPVLAPAVSAEATVPPPAVAPKQALAEPPAKPAAPDPVAQETTLFSNFGDRAKIEAVLVKLGYAIKSVDGFFADDTRAAIRQWQSQNGSDATGLLTATQRDTLITSFRAQGPRSFPWAITLSEDDLGANPDARLVAAVRQLHPNAIRYGFIDGKLMIAVLHWGRQYSAEIEAKNAGGRLATISSAAENTFAHSLFASDSRFIQISPQGNKNGPWIGLTRDPTAPPPKGGWHWADGGKITYRHWAEGQPNYYNRRDNCGRFYSHGRANPTSEPRPIVWDDAPCDFEANGFLMEIADAPQVTAKSK